MKLWQVHHPTWEIWIWHRKDLDRIELENQEFFENAFEVAPKSPYQFQADIARYEILYRYGGVWVDADFECQHPIDPLIEGLSEGTGWLAWEVEGQWLNNAIMAMPEAHSLMADAIDALPQNIQLKWPATNTLLSGPQFITPLALETADPLLYLPKDHFYPYLWNELHRGREEFPDSYAIHHWNNRRVRNEAPR